MSSSQKTSSKNFRHTAHAYLTELVESGQVTSQTELIAFIKAQGWQITRAGASYVTVAHPTGGRFRFRFVFGDEEGDTVVYALIAMGAAARACYIGSTSDFYNRMCQHAKLAGKKRFAVQRASTEFFSWAARHGVEVKALELQRLKGRAMLIAREAAWTTVAQHAGWLLPGVERWGAKTRSMVVCAPGMQHLHGALPDFADVDFSAARLLREIVDAGERPGLAERPDRDSRDFGVQLLVNPGNQRPFYVGLVRFDEERMEPGNGAEVFACTLIVDAIQAAGLHPQQVLLERVSGRDAVKHARSFWIETLVRAGGHLVNSDRTDKHRQAALKAHLAALASAFKPVERLALVAHHDQQQELLPSRHGERWSREEANSAKANYLAGSDITELSKKLQRKDTAIVAKLAHMAQSDLVLARRLMQGGVIDETGKPGYLTKP